MELFAALLAFGIILIPQAFDHSEHPKIKIRTEAFLWKAESEYTNFAKQIYDGDLIYKGRKKFVVQMLTQFKYPIERDTMKLEKATTIRPAKEKCVNELVDIPSRQNVRECKPEELK